MSPEVRRQLAADDGAEEFGGREEDGEDPPEGEDHGEGAARGRERVHLPVTNGGQRRDRHVERVEQGPALDQVVAEGAQRDERERDDGDQQDAATER